jgi:hypothetical protein
MNRHGSRETGESLWQRAINGLALWFAVLITFLAVPELYARTVAWISNYCATRYGAEFVPACEVAWFVILGFIVFHAAQASTAALILSGGMALAMKIF